MAAVQRDKLTPPKEEGEEEYHTSRKSIQIFGVSEHNHVTGSYQNNVLNTINTTLLQLTAKTFKVLKLLTNVKFSDLFGYDTNRLYELLEKQAVFLGSGLLKNKKKHKNEIASFLYRTW